MSSQPHPPTAVHGEGMTISAQLARHARSSPTQVALRFAGRSTTYAELDAETSRLAHLLTGLGVAAGDRVAILAYNGPEYVVTYLACARLGAIAVPLNFRLTASELVYQLDHSGARAVVVEDSRYDRAAAAAAGTAIEVALVIGDRPAGGVLAAVSWGEAVTSAPPTYPQAAVDEDGPAVIMYTSGTTGTPKGATLSHRNFSVWVTAKTIATGYPADCRRLLVGTPLFHIAALCSLTTAIYLAGTAVLVPSREFAPATMVGLLESERVNVAFFVPSQWQEVVRHAAEADHDFPDLWLAVWGAAPTSESLVGKIREAFPHAGVSTAFGQTEVCATATLLIGPDAVSRPSSVGRPMIHVECRVVDDEMNDVAPGEVGEIVYRGPTVMLGYWCEPERTAEAFRGGWFHSGDLVRADADGFLYVVDRKKDMIISGGENVYCAEVENVLAAHPKIADVAVVGAPDPRWGEVPVAFVVPRDGERAPTDSEIEAFGRERLATYKVPRRVIAVDRFPRNASGKVLKDQLRRRVPLP